MQQLCENNTDQRCTAMTTINPWYRRTPELTSQTRPTGYISDAKLAIPLRYDKDIRQYRLQNK